jgi:predicted DCC family thiol-disulfide oxidoreductase YuxK
MRIMDIPAGTPVLIYDGDCAFCSSSLRFGERVLGTDGWAAIPFQCADMDAVAAFTGGAATRARAEREVLWITPTGRVDGGADAVARLLLRTRRVPWLLLGAIALLPGLRTVMGALYRLVALNRDRLPGGTPACAIRPH